jgi:ABC-type amino acid transport substrate-binding protein
MRRTHWLVTGILGLLLTGCAGINTAPTPEARQALAPTGKLRVGLQLGSPHNVIRDSASGEMKGVAFDLGKELARRMGFRLSRFFTHRSEPFLRAGNPALGTSPLLGLVPSGQRSGTLPRCTWKSNSATSSLAVRPFQQRLMWIGPASELPCRRSPSRMSFFLAR